MAFDLLALGDEDLRALPQHERRSRLEAALATVAPPVHLTPVTSDRAEAHRWFERFEGAGLDGVIAKPIGDPYVEDRRVQFKLKHVRTADAVVAGFRIHKDGKGVGSLLLGLYDGDGRLHHVGVAASFTAKLRGELVERLAPYREADISRHPWGSWVDAAAHADGRMPGGCRAGAGARTCPGSRCAPSWSSRSPTPRCWPGASGRPRSCGAGAPTGPRSPAPTTRSRSRRRWRSTTCSAPASGER